MLLSPEDVRILTRLHSGSPLVDRPFAEVGAELGMDEEHLIERLRQLLAQGVLTRFGPLFQIERAGGRFVLAALAMPEEERPMALDEFDRELIATTQGGLPLVARPYEAVGAMLGVPGELVRERLAAMLDTGLIRRIGAVPNHYRLGYTATA